MLVDKAFQLLLRLIEGCFQNLVLLVHLFLLLLEILNGELKLLVFFAELRYSVALKGLRIKLVHGGVLSLMHRREAFPCSFGGEDVQVFLGHELFELAQSGTRDVQLVFEVLLLLAFQFEVFTCRLELVLSVS